MSEDVTNSVIEAVLSASKGEWEHNQEQPLIPSFDSKLLDLNTLFIAVQQRLPDGPANTPLRLLCIILNNYLSENMPLDPLRCFHGLIIQSLCTQPLPTVVNLAQVLSHTCSSFGLSISVV